MIRNLIVLTLLIGSGFVLQACGMKPTPQESCNFVQNGDQQRVSWGSQTPVVMYIDSSVPPTHFDAIKSAADIWNKAVGREVLKIGGWTNHAASTTPDGTNLIYFQRQWDGDTTEQARTTIYWASDRIYEADVKINDRDFSYTAESDTPKPKELDIESLMIHEFGHVLGMKHTNLTGSVMVPTLSGATASNLQAGLRRKLSDDDKKSVTCEY